MIIPCIDLMGGKVVQLIQGREKFLELPDPLAVLAKFADYPQIQVIDLDGALGRGDHSEIIRELCLRKPCRVGEESARWKRPCKWSRVARSKLLWEAARLPPNGINSEFLENLLAAVPREKLMIAWIASAIALRYAAGGKHCRSILLKRWCNSSPTAQNSSALTLMPRANFREPIWRGLKACGLLLSCPLPPPAVLPRMKKSRPWKKSV